jgi:hypothetical protein
VRSASCTEARMVTVWSSTVVSVMAGSMEA